MDTTNVIWFCAIFLTSWTISDSNAAKGACSRGIIRNIVGADAIVAPHCPCWPRITFLAVGLTVRAGITNVTTCHIVPLCAGSALEDISIILITEGTVDDGRVTGGAGVGRSNEVVHQTIIAGISTGWGAKIALTISAGYFGAGCPVTIGLVAEITVETCSGSVTEAAVWYRWAIDLSAGETTISGLITRAAEGTSRVRTAQNGAVSYSWSEGLIEKAGKNREE